MIQKKIEQLILAIQEDPFNGIGKPEPLKHDLIRQMV
ncbi:type II toxin-antitoxin system YoeB family toxin [Pedobacter sp.]